jgi:hypothetical protein
MRLYLDACCYNRPFDDQSQDRVHLEAEAVSAILRRAQAGNWHLVGSDVLHLEVAQLLDEVRRERVLQLVPSLGRCILTTLKEEQRAVELVACGIKPLDALHVACAEAAAADVFLSTDDRLLRALSREQAAVKLRVANPLCWLEEQVDEQH